MYTKISVLETQMAKDAGQRSVKSIGKTNYAAHELWAFELWY